jgi:hypothetical protein
MTLTVKDLEVGKTYRIVDLNNNCFGGCEFDPTASFTVSKIRSGQYTDLIYVDNVVYDGELGTWCVFSSDDTTTFELVN